MSVLKAYERGDVTWLELVVLAAREIDSSNVGEKMAAMPEDLREAVVGWALRFPELGKGIWVSSCNYNPSVSFEQLEERRREASERLRKSAEAIVGWTTGP